MAKITSRALINVGSELTINTTNRTITLNVAGNLIAKDGVTWQSLYSKFIELWTTADYNEFPFPFYAIDALSGQFQIGTDGARYNTWTWGDANTRTYLRDGGWSEYVATTPDNANTSATGTLQRQYAGIVSLGTVSTGAQLYYQNTATGSALNFTFTDAVNEGVKVYENGVYDTRSFFKGFVREYGFKYKDSVLADTGKTATGAYIVNLLLSNETDLDITANDSVVSTTIPYANTIVRYFANTYQKSVGYTAANNFGIVVDVGTHSGVDGTMTASGTTLTSSAGGIVGADYTSGTIKVHNGANKGTYNITGTPSGTVVTITGATFPATQANASFTIYRQTPLTVTLKQIHTKLQYLLRQNSNINTASGNTVIGKTASLLSNFVGSRLDMGFYTPSNPNWKANTTLYGSGSGVMVEGIATADTNSIRFYDNTTGGTTFTEYPFTSSGSLNFNTNLTANTSGYYRLYYKDLTGNNDYGFINAITVKNSAGANITGTITSSGISFDYDYTNDSTGGRTPGTDVAVVLVAGNPGYAKPVVSEGTITQSKTIVISAVAESDRAFL
jgi:hypothetical protein